MALGYDQRHRSGAYHGGMSAIRRACLLVLYGSLLILIPWSGCCCVRWPAPMSEDVAPPGAMLQGESPYMLIQIGCTAAGVLAGILLLSGVVLLHKGQLRNAGVTEAARRSGWCLVVGWAIATVLLTCGLLWRLEGTAMAVSVPDHWPVYWLAAAFLLWIGLVLACGAVLRRDPPPTPWDEPSRSGADQVG